MTLCFSNEDITNMRFEIRWGKDNKTTSFKLAKGSVGVLDLDTGYKIPNDEQFWIYAWEEGTGLAYISKKPFKYKKGKGVAGTIKFSKAQFEADEKLTSPAAA